jgi:hypothetical protein
MKPFTGNKDVDRSILMQLSDKDLLHTCLANKYTNEEICNDDFYKIRLYNNYRETFDYFNNLVKDSSKDSTFNWKKLYLNWIYILDKSKLKNSLNKFYNFNFAIELAIERNDLLLLEYLDKHPPRFMLLNIPTFLIFEPVNWNHALVNTLLGKQFDIATYIVTNKIKEIDLGTLNSALSLSVSYNNIELTNLLIEKGADLNMAVSTAAKQGNIDSMKYFASKGKIDWQSVEKNVKRTSHMRKKTGQEEAVMNYIKANQ